jgi:histidinol-phosphatase (PHP family)
MFDFHSHTNNSEDSKQTIDSLCCSAINMGLKGIAITDHADIWFYDERDYLKTIGKSISDAKYAKDKYKNDLEVFVGIELAEYLSSPEKGNLVLDLHNFDVILGSVHSIKYGDMNDSYSRINFGNDVSNATIDGFLREYFNRVYEMATKTDFDILTHLNCPFRYINGKFGRNISIKPYENIIKEIFSVIIERNISLEVNTSGIGTALNSTMPDLETISLYKKMGGKLITLGSDAHTPEGVAKGFKKVIPLLNEIGFVEYCFFRDRKIQTEKLEF